MTGLADLPPIIGASEWLGYSSHAFTFGHPMPHGPVGEWIAHHTIVPDLDEHASMADEAHAMRAVHEYHLHEKFGGFAYQWAIFDSGRIWEGRGWGRTGAHTIGRNSRSVAFVWFIDGDKRVPSDRAFESAKFLLTIGEVAGHVARSAPLDGHRHWASYKDCPGSHVTDDHLRYLRAAVDGTYPKGSR